MQARLRSPPLCHITQTSAFDTASPRTLQHHVTANRPESFPRSRSESGGRFPSRPSPALPQVPHFTPSTRQAHPNPSKARAAAANLAIHNRLRATGRHCQTAADKPLCRSDCSGSFAPEQTPPERRRNGVMADKNGQTDAAAGSPATVRACFKCCKLSKRSCTLDVDPTATVRSLRPMIEEETGIPAAQQKLIYMGQVLKDKHTLQFHNFQDGHTIHIMKVEEKKSCCPIRAARHAAASRRQQAAAPPNAIGGQPGLSAMLESPYMQQMMARLEENPEFLASMAEQMSNAPEMRAMLERHPEMGPVLRDPEMMRQSLRMARDPALRHQMTRQQDQAMANLSAMPGGFNALRRFYNDVQVPMMDATSQRGSGAGRRRAAAEDNPFACLLDQSAPPDQAGPAAADPQSAAAAPNSQAVPNPWAPSRPSASARRPDAPSNPFGALFGSRAPSRTEPSASGPPSAAAPGPSSSGGVPGCPLGSSPGAPPGMGAMMGMNPESMLQMLENPAFQQHMEAMVQNPDMIRAAIESNPMIRDNPVAREQLEAMLASPEYLRHSMNPDFIRQSLQMQQAFAGATPHNQAVSPELMQQMRSFMTPQQGATNGAGPVPPRERFAGQLQTLVGMGFTDEEACLAGECSSRHMSPFGVAPPVVACSPERPTHPHSPTRFVDGFAQRSWRPTAASTARSTG